MVSVLGSKIKLERKKLKLTLDQLAEMTNSSKSYIWELENKADANPTADKILKLAEALKVSVDYLLVKENSDAKYMEEQTFFRRFEKLNDDQKRMLDTLITSFANDKK